MVHAPGADLHQLLYDAIRWRNHKLVKAILRTHLVDVNKRLFANDVTTFFELACYYCHPGNIRMLYRAGAQVTPLSISSLSNCRQTEILIMLFENGLTYRAMDHQTRKKCYPIHVIIEERVTACKAACTVLLHILKKRMPNDLLQFIVRGIIWKRRRVFFIKAKRKK